MIDTTIKQQCLYSMLRIQTALAFDLYSAGDLSWASLEGSLDLINNRVTPLRESKDEVKAQRSNAVKSCSTSPWACGDQSYLTEIECLSLIYFRVSAVVTVSIPPHQHVKPS